MVLPVINMFWHRGALTSLQRLSVVSFLANGHPVELYSYGGVDNAPTGTTLRDAAEVLPEDAIGGAPTGSPQARSVFFSNIFRYALLLKGGGIWCDTDVVCVRPLSFAAEMPMFFASERLPPGPNQEAGKTAAKVASCAMQLPAGSEVAQRCLDRAKAIDPARSAWGSAGPSLLTEVVKNTGNLGYVLAPEAFCPIDWWNFHGLLTGFAILPDNCHAVHLWNEMWRRNLVAPDQRFDPLCLVERLRRHYHIE